MNQTKLTVLLGVSLAVLPSYGMTISDLAKLDGQEYVEGRERLLELKELADYAPNNVRERVAWLALQVWRAHQKLHAQLLPAERAEPGIFSGRVTATQLWANEAFRKLESPDDKFIVAAEVTLFRPFKEWSKPDANMKTCWGPFCMASEAPQATNLLLDKRVEILLTVMRQGGRAAVTEITSVIMTGYTQQGTGIEVLKELVFRAEGDAFQGIIGGIVKEGKWPSQYVRDVGDELLRKGVQARTSIIKSIVADGWARKRVDVLIALADGIRERGLALLDLGSSRDSDEIL